MLPRGTWALRNVQRRQNSSFIKRVMDQVKDDLEKSEGYRTARADLEKSGATNAREKLRQQALAQEETLRRWRETMSSKAASTKSLFQKMKEQAQGEKEKLQTRLHETIGNSETSSEPHRFIVQARASSQKCMDQARIATRAVGSGVGRFLDATRAATAVFDTREGQTRHEAWIAQRDRNKVDREACEAQREEEQVTAARESPPSDTSAKKQEEVSALVVRHETAWDRFGAKLGDMPFLSSMYDNPLFDRMFAETELAQSIREMKEVDPQFSLAEFADEIEHVVAPQVVKCFLTGDRETLFRHCTGPAFAAVDSSMKERTRQKCYLDPDILLGPVEVELKGAKTLENGTPNFIWTFQTQQVNCLRDAEHNVIEGAVDDIRTVYYAMALTRHPTLDEDPDAAMSLDYRWQISELAIVGNQQCW